VGMVFDTSASSQKQIRFLFYCPACNTKHLIVVDRSDKQLWNEDVSKPTIKGILSSSKNNHICRIKLINGKITFLEGTTNTKCIGCSY
jgi:hypothetical protein